MARKPHDELFFKIHQARRQLTLDRIITEERRQLRVAVLFSGTRSVERAAQQLGHLTFGIDNNPDLSPDLVKDMQRVTALDFPWRPDVLWASPVCTGFSVAAIGKGWNRGMFGKDPAQPVSESAKLSLDLVRHTLRIIDELCPTVVYMENPVAMLRAIPHLVDLSRFTRRTVTYCSYGDTAQKPTDIWTNNVHWEPRPMCPQGGYGEVVVDGVKWRTKQDGTPCHVSASRGTRQPGSTQGKSNATERGRVPLDLITEALTQLPPGMFL